MQLIITGTPGTGKTTIARLIANYLGYRLFDLKGFITDRRMYRKNAKGEMIVDMPRLKRTLPPILKREKNFVLEGHIACELKLPADVVFVLRTKPPTLKRRLLKRKYSKAKVQENVMAELLDYCTQRVISKYKMEPLELETSGKSRRTCRNKILEAIRERKKKLDAVDYSEQLKKHLGIENE